MVSDDLCYYIYDCITCLSSSTGNSNVLAGKRAYRFLVLCGIFDLKNPVSYNFTYTLFATSLKNIGGRCRTRIAMRGRL